MSFDLGFIQAIHSGAVAPINTQMLWYDTNVNLHKYYDTGSMLWTSLASGAASWSTVLASGAASGGTNPIISAGDKMLFNNGLFQVGLETSVLTADRTLQLPDQDGILATLADVAMAGNLSVVLGLGNITSGNDIIMTVGDKITSPTGVAFIDLEDTGVVGQVLLEGSTLVTVRSQTHLKLVGDTIISLIGGGGQQNAATATGFGFNTGAPESIVHVNVPIGAPAVGSASVFKVKRDATKQLHFGHNTDYAYINSYGNRLAISTHGDLVTIGGGSYNPTITPRLLVGTTSSANTIAVITGTTNTGGFSTYRGATETLTMNFGHSTSGVGLIEHAVSNANIDFKVNKGGVTKTVMQLNGQRGSVAIQEELISKLSTAAASVPNPGGIMSSVDIQGKTVHIVNYNTVGNHSGLAGGYPGRMLWLTNNGSALTLDDNNVFLAGDNQFFCPGGVDLVLGQKMSALLYYDDNVIGGNGGWRVLSVAQ